jgi:type IV secretory pathway VirB9-like protein
MTRRFAAVAVFLLAGPLAASSAPEVSGPPAGAPEAGPPIKPTPSLAAPAAPEPPAFAPATPESETLAAARSYREGHPPPVLEHSTYTRVPYGHVQPVLRCAPLRVSAIELEEGETVLSKSTGDSERWAIAVTSAGLHGKTPLVVVKPSTCDATTTNLLLSTDRRIYDVTLDSPGCRKADGGHDGDDEGVNPKAPYTRLLRFYYPEDLVTTLASEEQLERSRASADARNRTPLPSSAPLTSLNFDYRWDSSSGFPWAPLQVFDDGAHVYIHFPAVARDHEAPLLFLLGEKGATDVLNFAVRGDFYVTDRVFARAALVLGAKRKSPRLTIENRSYRSR